MDELLTHPTSEVIAQAATEARAFGHGTIGPEHLFLALLAHESTAPTRLGRGEAITTLRARLIAQLHPGDDSGAGVLAYNLGGKQVIDEALARAREDGCAVDPEDLLAALVAHAGRTSDSPLGRARLTDLL